MDKERHLNGDTVPPTGSPLPMNPTPPPLPRKLEGMGFLLVFAQVETPESVFVPEDGLSLSLFRLSLSIFLSAPFKRAFGTCPFQWACS
jgi:hypothetical protein